MERDGNAEYAAQQKPPDTLLHRRAKRTLSKACVACHNSKSRCDGAVVGIPCTRCVEKGWSGTCARAERKQRRRNLPKTPASALSLAGSTASAATAASAAGDRPPTLAAAARPQHGHAEPRDAAADFAGTAAFGCPTPAGSSPARDAAAALEEHEDAYAEIQICREMLNGKRVSRPAWPDPPASRELVQYHHSQHYLTILGEALSKDKRRRMTRIVLDGIRPHAARRPVLGPDGAPDPLAGLDDVDRDYLLKKRVLDLPPKECVELIFKAYFDFVYPYAPILNRVEFVRDYYANRYSPFMVQAVLASGALYVALSVLHACGFSTRSEAQAAFFARATLLYDFGCERRQLRMLQGSAILGSTPCAHETDKEFRYWFYNAVRLAVKMGLHQGDLAEEVEPSSYKLCKRIWWYLLGRDVLFSFVGVQNMRLIGADSNNICALTMDDFELDAIPPELGHILAPASLSQRLCFVENGMLALAAAACLATIQSEGNYHRLEDDAFPFGAWRAALLDRLCATRDPSASAAGDVSLTVALAQSYRLECIIFRLLRTWLQFQSPERFQLAKKRLRGAMFELDTILGRAMMQGTLSRFPLSIISIVPSLLALHIEITLDEAEPEVVRTLSRTYIRQNMMLLRLTDDFPTIHRSIPVFEWVLQQKCLYDHDPSTLVDSAASSQRPPESVMGDALASANESIKSFRPSVPAPDGCPIDSPPAPAGWFDDFIRPDYLDNLYLTSFL